MPRILLHRVNEMELHENVAYHSYKRRLLPLRGGKRRAGKAHVRKPVPLPRRGRGRKRRAEKAPVYEEVTPDKGREQGKAGKEPVYNEVILNQETKIPVAAPGSRESKYKEVIL